MNTFTAHKLSSSECRQHSETFWKDLRTVDNLLYNYEQQINCAEMFDHVPAILEMSEAIVKAWKSHHIGKIKDDEANKLGISWLWALPISHPLTPAGWIHDQLYRSDISKNLSRRYADRVFLEICNRLAGNSWKLKAQAHLFYRLVRLFGGNFWEGRP